MIKKIEEIDIFKAIAAILVILIHVTANPVVTLEKGSSLLKLFVLINRMAKPSVPMFIFASGFVLFYRYQNRNFEYIKFLKKRFNSILIPYILWTIVYYFIFIFLGYYSFSFTFLIENLIFGSMVYHLYFILIIFQFYLLFGLFRYGFKNFNSHGLLAVSILWNILFMKWMNFSYMDRFFMTYLSYFTLGCYLAFHIEKFYDLLLKFKIYIVSLFFISGIYYSYQFYNSEILKKPVDYFFANIIYIIFSIIAIIFFYYIGVIINTKNIFTKVINPLQIIDNRFSSIKNIFLEISKGSFYIYLAHPLAILICDTYFFNKFNIVSISGRSLFSFLFIGITVIPISIFYVNIKNRFLYKGKFHKRKEQGA